MRKPLLSFFAGLALAIVVMVAGCNREGLPGLGRVTGTVTLDGKPVPEAAIMFTPKETGATSSVGRTDASGNYELYYSRGNKGAKIGEHTVTLNTFQEAGEDGAGGLKETIPSRYNVKTELTANIKRGDNKVDFALKSGGEIIQPNEDPTTGKKKARSITGCN